MSESRIPGIESFLQIPIHHVKGVAPPQYTPEYPVEPLNNPAQRPYHTLYPEAALRGANENMGGPAISTHYNPAPLEHPQSSSDCNTMNRPASHRKGHPQAPPMPPHPRNGTNEVERKGVAINEPFLAVPTWSEMKTKAGKERKRLPLACIACRQKKIRCSGEKPACRHCLRSRTSCFYKVSSRKPGPRTDYMALIGDRISRMEERIRGYAPKNGFESVNGSTRASAKPSAKIPSPPPSASKKRAVDEAFGAEMDSWAASASTTEEGNGPPPARRQRIQESEEQKLLCEGEEFLPSSALQEHLVEIFFEYVYGQTYHLLHRPSFLRSLQAGTVPPFLMLAVCAISARFSSHPELSQEPAFRRGEVWASEARGIVMRRYDQPSINILTALILLGLHDFGSCLGGSSWALGGMAVRMAFALQLHRELDHDPVGRKGHTELSPTDREIRRRVMWACFLMDRFTSSGSERPPCANEHSIKIQLPIKEDYFTMEISGPTESLSADFRSAVSSNIGQLSNAKENMGIAAYMVRIIALWGRVIEYFNLGGKDRDPHAMWSSSSRFSELIAQAEAFKAGLPNPLQYTAENLHYYSSERLANQFLFLHIAYHQVLLFLNKFAVPTTSGASTPKDMPESFLSKAGHAAIHAADQISALIRDSEGHAVVAPFIGYCAFLSSTVHIIGIFSKNTELKTSSRRNLVSNVHYLGQMRRYWGMFHFMAENLKEIYSQHVDALSKGDGKGNHPSTVFQYGDWFTKYPNGVSPVDLKSLISSKSLEGESEGKKAAHTDAEDEPASSKAHEEVLEELHHPTSKPAPAPPRRQENVSIYPESFERSNVEQLLASPTALESLPPTDSAPPMRVLAEPSFPAQLQPVQPLYPSMSYPQDTLAYATELCIPGYSLNSQADDSRPLDDLEQQLVLGTHPGMGPIAMAQSQVEMEGMDGMGVQVWNDLDMGGLNTQGMYANLETAWFVPVNMEPPQIGGPEACYFVGGDGVGGAGYVM
ncbi:MAG: hypothetical protein M1829_006013 [Trizodia sp. TS-e1964]|nr:MAG: hypothetical protein M1829_006013 [Trizodia sp. TS-e1964]